jgi:hypothetical protein
VQELPLGVPPAVFEEAAAIARALILAQFPDEVSTMVSHLCLLFNVLSLFDKYCIKNNEAPVLCDCYKAVIVVLT